MAMFLTPEEHDANPPASWSVHKAAERAWQLRTSDSTVLDTFPRKAGESVNGWKPYSECADRMRRASEARQAVRP